MRDSKNPLVLFLAFALMVSFSVALAVYASPSDPAQAPVSGDIAQGGICFCRVPPHSCGGVGCWALGLCPCTCYCESPGHPYCSCRSFVIVSYATESQSQATPW